MSVREVSVPRSGYQLTVEISIPEDAPGIVILGRDNGNVVHHRSLGHALHRSGLATAYCDLLRPEERAAARKSHRTPVTVATLASRLTSVLDAVRALDDPCTLSVGIVAAGRLAAAALQVASRRPLDLDAVVCRGGRVDLVPDLEFIQTPTLLIASATDPYLLRMNEAVFQKLHCPKRFDILAGALNELDDEHSFEIAIEETIRWLQDRLAQEPCVAMMK